MVTSPILYQIDSGPFEYYFSFDHIRTQNQGDSAGVQCKPHVTTWSLTYDPSAPILWDGLTRTMTIESNDPADVGFYSMTLTAEMANYAGGSYPLISTPGQLEFQVEIANSCPTA